jgi:hypothetical protein
MPTKLNNKVSTDVEEVTDGEDSFLMWMTAFFLTVPHHEKLKILELKTMVFWNVLSCNLYRGTTASEELVFMSRVQP